jgi:hypothetical protein
VKELKDLKPALSKALAEVRAGAVCVVDVRVLPGYDTAMGGTPPSASRK